MCRRTASRIGLCGHPAFPALQPLRSSSAPASAVLQPSSLCGHPASAVIQPLRSSSAMRQCPSDFTWPATWPCLSCLKSICATITTTIGLPMSARIHFPLQYLPQVRLWPTDQANPYPYTRGEEENSDWKFNRLEKLLPLGHLATWPESHLSQLSRSVSVEKYFGLKLLFASDLRKLAKYFLSAE